MKFKTVKLSIKNSSRKSFMKTLGEIPRLAYEVENLSGGRIICITKPGGKGPQDFMVWVYNQLKEEGRLLSHEEIKKDLIAKGAQSRTDAQKIIAALRRVHDGEDPEDVLPSLEIARDLPGEKPELILKVYKWIWGQEDCNYPQGQGRSLSMNALLKLFP